MHDFHFLDGELYCESLKVGSLASRTKTPFYLYSRRTITEHYRKLEEALSPVEHLICYSLKANSNIAICRILSSMGAGADVTSGGELYKAIYAGIDPGKIVFAGVGKTSDEIKFALDAKILMFNVESLQELKLINELAGKVSVRAPVAIRLNPDVEVDTHDYTKTGTSENKFGLSFEDAEKIFLSKSEFPCVDMVGLHLHIGSQITDVKPYVESIGKAQVFLEKLRDKRIPLTWMNIGGGLGIVYKDEKPSSAAEFADAVLPLLKSAGLKVIIEPGRFIVGNAGILVTRVLYTKKTPSRSFAVVDAGMNDLIRPTLYNAYHDIKLLRSRASPGKEEVDIVGPICESGDFFARGREMPLLESGDFLAIFSVGAYGFSMASNYNSRLRGTEFLVERDRVRLIRERETYGDLLRAETFGFTKMCAGGNDFIVIDNRFGNYPDAANLAKKLCRRSYSIGADGLISLETGRDAAKLRMRIFNPDGSEAEMCGNGARCLSAYLYRRGITRTRAEFATLAGPVEAEVRECERPEGNPGSTVIVKLKMGDPKDIKLSLKLKADGVRIRANFINTGVPHTVVIVDNVEKVDVGYLGPKIRRLPEFEPQGTNVDFVEVLERDRISLRTYERGVENETLACGTGAVASAIICFLLKRVHAPVSVETRGGETLSVIFSAKEEISDVYLEGNATFVYDGSFGGADLYG